VKEIKGKIKEVAGKVLGDAKLETEGKADQVAGKVQNAAAASKTRSKEHNRHGGVLGDENPLLRTVAGPCRRECGQFVKDSNRRRVSATSQSSECVGI